MFSIRPLPIISLIFATFNSVGQLLLILLFISIGVPLSAILCNPLFRFAISLSLSLSLFFLSLSRSLFDPSLPFHTYHSSFLCQYYYHYYYIYFPALKPETNNKKRNYQRVCHQCFILCRSFLSFFLQFSFTYQIDPVLFLSHS